MSYRGERVPEDHPSTQALHDRITAQAVNLRLAVELTAGALRLGRIEEAIEHLDAVIAPTRLVGVAKRGIPPQGVFRAKRVLPSTIPPEPDWRHTRPSALVEYVRWRCAVERIPTQREPYPDE